MMNKKTQFCFSEDSNKSIFDREEHILNLRKIKLNKKIFIKRKEAYTNNNDLINTKGSFIKFLAKLDKINEDDLFISLKYLSTILEIKLNSQNDNKNCIFLPDDFDINAIFNNNMVEKICLLGLKYFYVPKIIIYISNILLLGNLILYRELKKNINDYNSHIDDNLSNVYSISSYKFIKLYNKIIVHYLEKNLDISYYIIDFITSIIEGSKDNQIYLYLNGILQYIVDSVNSKTDSEFLYFKKLRCISLFEVKYLYISDYNLFLEIQKLYLDIFTNKKSDLLNNINNKIDDYNNFLYLFIIIIRNLSFCIDNIFMENLIKSGILIFLINIKNSQYLEIIIEIIINITKANEIMISNLINIKFVEFLVNIISDKSLNYQIHKSSIIAINNLMKNNNICNTMLFGKKVVEIFCQLFKLLLSDNNINIDIFIEICYGLEAIVNFYSNEIIEYKLMENICKQMKLILSDSKNEEGKIMAFFYFSNFIIYFISNKEEQLTKKIIKNFQNIDGEKIFDLALNVFNRIDNDIINKEKILLDKDIISEIKGKFGL